MKRAVPLLGHSAERKLTSAAERSHQRTFGRQRPASRLIMQRSQRRPNRLIVKANLSGNNTLTGGRNALFEWNGGRDPRAKTKPPEAGTGQHQGVEGAGIELCQAGIDVAADGTERCAWQEGFELRAAANTAGADGCAGPEARKDLGRCHVTQGSREDDAVAWIFAREAGGDGQTLGKLDWQILRAVDGQIGIAAQQCIFEFFDELPLAVVAGDGPMLRAIASRHECQDFRPDSGRMQAISDSVRLP